MSEKYVLNKDGIHPFYFKGTALANVSLYVILFGLWAAFIVWISVHVIDTEVSSVLITAVGGFLSLMLGFRTNTAYDRFWEGRRLWSQMTGTIRELALNVWLDYDAPTEKDKATKVDMVNLVLGFAIVAKHALREEDELMTSDLKKLIEKLPNFDKLPKVTYSSLTDSETKDLNSKLVKRRVEKKTSKLPLQLAYYMIAINDAQINRGLVGPGTHSSLLQLIEELIATYTGMERILYTPIPTAYTVHLRQCIFIFCLALPFELLSYMSKRHWLSVPFTMISVFVLYGILAIGEEIENPFGYDPNDLPIDAYCCKLDRELQSIMKLKQSWSEMQQSGSDYVSGMEGDEKQNRSSTDTLHGEKSEKDHVIHEPIMDKLEGVIDRDRELTQADGIASEVDPTNAATSNSSGTEPRKEGGISPTPTL